jgi:hypothetical protein
MEQTSGAYLEWGRVKQQSPEGGGMGKNLNMLNETNVILLCLDIFKWLR